MRQAKPSQAQPSQAKPSQAKPSQAKPSQAKPSQAITVALVVAVGSACGSGAPSGGADVAYEPESSVDDTGTPSPSDSIARATLIRPGSVTHQFDMDQRLVEMDITNRTGTTLTMLSPLDATIAPPGWYMLFLLAENGVPSEAVHIQLQ